MRTTRKIIVLLWVLVGVISASAYAQELQVRNVEVRESPVRETPSFLGKVLEKVAYSKPVNILEDKGDWLKVSVQDSGVEGWMHISALTKKSITLKAGEKNVDIIVNANEVDLAARTWEELLKAENAVFDYSIVDKMQKVVIPESEMQSFLKKGGLAPEGGLQ